MNTFKKILFGTIFFIAVWIGCTIVVLVISDLGGFHPNDENRGVTSFFGLLLAIVVMIVRRWRRTKRAAEPV